MIDLSPYYADIRKLCQELAVRRLELVGSAARSDFSPDSSDIDVLIEFEREDMLFTRYFELKQGLERIFGREVDVIQSGAVRNPYVRESMQRDRIAVYEA